MRRLYQVLRRLDRVAVEDEQIHQAGADGGLVLDDEQAGLSGHGWVIADQ